MFLCSITRRTFSFLGIQDFDVQLSPQCSQLTNEAIFLEPWIHIRNLSVFLASHMKINHQVGAEKKNIIYTFLCFSIESKRVNGDKINMKRKTEKKLLAKNVNDYFRQISRFFTPSHVWRSRVQVIKSDFSLHLWEEGDF